MKYSIETQDGLLVHMDEKGVVEMCLDGRCGSTTKVTKDGLFETAQSILNFPVFERAIEAREKQDREAKAKASAQHNPDPLLTLLVRDALAEEIQRFTVVQIRNLFANGKLSADAEFKHPHYDDWFPCRSLFGSSGDAFSGQRWEYFILPLNVSGTTLGVISAFLEKNVSDESTSKLAQLGAQGWELVAVIPVTSGAIGTSWSNSALAFLKRQRT